MIAGVNQETTVDLSKDGGKFVYHSSMQGDGTVPLAMAELPGVAATYYVEEGHGSLPNNRTVAKAVKGLLSEGKTDALPTKWRPSRVGR